MDAPAPEQRDSVVVEDIPSPVSDSARSSPTDAAEAEAEEMIPGDAAMSELDSQADGSNIPYVRLATWTVGAPGYQGELARDLTMIAQVVSSFDVVCMHGIRPGDTWQADLPRMAAGLTGGSWEMRQTVSERDPYIQGAVLWRSDRLVWEKEYHRVVPHDEDRVPMVPAQAFRFSFLGRPFWLASMEIIGPPLGRAGLALEHASEIMERLTQEPDGPPAFFCLQSNTIQTDSKLARMRAVSKPMELGGRGMDRRSEVPPYTGATIWTSYKRPMRAGFFPIAETLGLSPRDAQSIVAPTSPQFILTPVTP